MIDENEVESLRHTEYNSDPVVMDMLDTIGLLLRKVDKLQIENTKLAEKVERLKKDIQDEKLSFSNEIERLEYEGLELKEHDND